jgi:ABC-type sugar transport system substrate-binding protein
MERRKVVIALLTQGQPFQLMQARDARETAARLGLDVEVVFAEGHAVVQIQQLFRHIHAPEGERPAALVVEAATAEGLERVGRNAVRAGIGWLLVNANVGYVDELRAAHPGLPIALIGSDQLEVGRIQGRQCRALVPRGGQVLCVQGPADSTATQGRSAGLKETLGTGYEVRWLNGAWTEPSGEKAVVSWLRLKTSETFHPSLVVAQNDSMAAGAQKALRELRHEWRDLACIGCDGLPDEGQKRVAEGRLAATVITPSNTGPALEIVARWLETRVAPPREVLLAPRSFPPEAELRPGRRP